MDEQFDPSELVDELPPGAVRRTYDLGPATVFGMNLDGSRDRQDNGVGAWGTRTDNTDIVGVSLPIKVIRDRFGKGDAAHGRLVEVVNPRTGATILAPIVDKGPAEWTGNALDLTHRAAHMLGSTGKDDMAYRILDDNEHASAAQRLPQLMKDGTPLPIASVRALAPNVNYYEAEKQFDPADLVDEFDPSELVDEFDPADLVDEFDPSELVDEFDPADLVTEEEYAQADFTKRLDDAATRRLDRGAEPTWMEIAAEPLPELERPDLARQPGANIAQQAAVVAGLVNAEDSLQSRATAGTGDSGYSPDTRAEEAAVVAERERLLALGLDDAEIARRKADLAAFTPKTASRLSDGTIIVNPDFVFSPDKWEAAARSVGGTEEQVQAALNARMAMREDVAPEVDAIAQRSAWNDRSRGAKWWPGAYGSWLTKRAQALGLPDTGQLYDRFTEGDLLEEYYSENGGFTGNAGALSALSMRGAVASVGQGIYGAADMLTPDAIDPIGFQELADVARAQGDETSRIAQAVGGGWWAKRVAAVSGAAVGTLPVFLAAPAGLAGMATAGGLMQAGQTQNDAIAAGYTPGQALALGVGSGLVEGGLTAAFGATGFEAIAGGKMAGGIARRFATGAASELPEELLQQAAQIPFTSATNPDYRPTAEEFLDTGIAAALMGGGMHVMHGQPRPQQPAPQQPAPQQTPAAPTFTGAAPSNTVDLTAFSTPATNASQSIAPGGVQTTATATPLTEPTAASGTAPAPVALSPDELAAKHGIAPELVPFVRPTDWETLERRTPGTPPHFSASDWVTKEATRRANAAATAQPAPTPQTEPATPTAAQPQAAAPTEEQPAAASSAATTSDDASASAQPAALPDNSQLPTLTPQQMSPEDKAAYDAAQAEYQAEMQAALEEHSNSFGVPLDAAVRAAGGLPRPDSPKAGAFTGELRRLQGELLEARKGERGRGKKSEATILDEVFSDNAEGDAIVTSLRAQGFDVNSIAEIADLLEDGYRQGKHWRGTGTDLTGEGMQSNTPFSQQPAHATPTVSSAHARTIQGTVDKLLKRMGLGDGATTNDEIAHLLARARKAAQGNGDSESRITPAFSKQNQPQRASWDEVKVRDRWDAVKKHVPKDSIELPLWSVPEDADAAVGNILRWMSENASVTTSRGERVLIQNPEKGNLRKRAEHFAGAAERTGGVEKGPRRVDLRAQYVPAIKTTVENPSAVLIQGGTAIFVRRYKNGIIHAVFMDGGKTVVDHEAFDDGVKTHRALQKAEQLQGAALAWKRGKTAASGTDASADRQTVPQPNDQGQQGTAPSLVDAQNTQSNPGVKLSQQPAERAIERALLADPKDLQEHGLTARMRGMPEAQDIMETVGTELYETYTDKAAIADATRWLGERTEEQAIDELMNLEQGQANKLRGMAGQLMVQRLSDRGEHTRAGLITQKLAKIATTFGQYNQALHMMLNLGDASTVLAFAQKEFSDAAEKKFKTQEGADAAVDLANIKGKMETAAVNTATTTLDGVAPEITAGIATGKSDLETEVSALVDAAKGDLSNAERTALQDRIDALDLQLRTLQQTSKHELGKTQAELEEVRNKLALARKALQIEKGRGTAGHIAQALAILKNAHGLTEERKAELLTKMRSILTTDDGSTNTIDRLKGILVAAGMKPVRAGALAKRVVEGYRARQKRVRESLLRQLAEGAAPRTTSQLKKGDVSKWLKMNSEGMLDDGKLFAGIAKRWGFPTFTSTDAAKAKDFVRRYNSTDSADVKLSIGADMMDWLISHTSPATFFDQYSAIFRLTKLMSPKTLFRIMGGNIAAALVESVAIDVPLWVISNVGVVNGRTYKPLHTAISATVEGYREAKRIFREGKIHAQSEGKSGASGGLHVLLAAAKAHTSGIRDAGDLKRQAASVFSSRAMKGFETFMHVMLTLPDYPRFAGEVRQSLARSMQREGNEVPTAEQYERAYLDGQRSVWLNKDKVAKWASQGAKWLNFNQKFGLGTILVPFVTVPTNRTIEGAKWTPIGFIQSLYELHRDRGTGYQRSAAKTLIKAAVGSTGIGYLGAYLFALGILTAGDDDDRDVQKLRELAGWQRYSINASELMRRMLTGDWMSMDDARKLGADGLSPVDSSELQRKLLAGTITKTDAKNLLGMKWQDGDMIESYMWLQPLAFSLAAGAERERLARKYRSDAAAGKPVPEEGWWTSLAQPLSGGFMALKDQPMLAGLKLAVDDFTAAIEGKSALELTALFTRALDVVPSMLRDVRYGANDALSETRHSNAVIAELNRIVGGVPLSGLPQRYDILGRAQHKYDAVRSGWLNALFNPLTERIVRRDPLVEEALRLWSTTGSKASIPDAVMKQVRKAAQPN